MNLWLACCSSLCLKPSPCLMEKARRDLGWLPAGFHQRAIGGFTLAELLISLAILGVIATFTIPKILSTQQNSSYNSKAKELAGMVSAAYKNYIDQNGGPSSTFHMGLLTPYLNYTAVDTSTTIDYNYTQGTLTCGTAWHRCLRLHNGGIMRYGDSSNTMNGTQTTNAIWFDLDPDGVADASPTGPGKAVQFWLYSTGRVSTMGTITPGTCFSSGCNGPNPSQDPPWLRW